MERKRWGEGCGSGRGRLEMGKAREGARRTTGMDDRD